MTQTDTINQFFEANAVALEQQAQPLPERKKRLRKAIASIALVGALVSAAGVKYGPDIAEDYMDGDSITDVITEGQVPELPSDESIPTEGVGDITSFEIINPVHVPDADESRGSLAEGLGETTQDNGIIDTAYIGNDTLAPIYETSADQDPREETIASLYNSFAAASSEDVDMVDFVDPAAVEAMRQLKETYPQYVRLEFALGEEGTAERIGNHLTATNVVVYGVPADDSTMPRIQSLRPAEPRPEPVELQTLGRVEIDVTQGEVMVPTSRTTQSVERVTGLSFFA